MEVSENCVSALVFLSFMVEGCAVTLSKSEAAEMDEWGPLDGGNVAS